MNWIFSLLPSHPSAGPSLFFLLQHLDVEQYRQAPRSYPTITMEEADLVIIGACIFGLTTAHTYHRLHPSSKILILDSSPSIGGPWAPQRIFPGLKTNNLLGMYEHPDFPMDEQRFRVKRGKHIDAANMFDYITAFVEWADIKQFIRLGTNVETIEKDDEEKGWTLRCAPSSLSEGRRSRRGNWSSR